MNIKQYYKMEIICAIGLFLAIGPSIWIGDGNPGGIALFSYIIGWIFARGAFRIQS